MTAKVAPSARPHSLRPLPFLVFLTLLYSMLATRAAEAEPSEKRSVPAYDGRDSSTTAGDVALWVPRVALAPVYLVSEFVIRRPLGALVTWAERSGAPKAIYDFFTFGEEHNAGFAPIGFVDFGFNPSVGVYAFWKNAGVRGHDLALHATTWGHEWIAGVFDERVAVAERTALAFNFTVIHRPDLRFHGLGPDTRERDRTRYSQDLVSMRMTFDAYPLRGRAHRIEPFVGMRTTSFYEGHYSDDIGTIAAARNSGKPLPDGFATGFTTVDTGARVALDSRGTTPGSSLSGVRVDADFMQSSDIQRTPASSWVSYGGTLGGFVDLNDRGRVLNTAISVRFSDPLGSEPVPFSELVDGGGDGPLRGFLSGRLRGSSVASAALRYRWPIWVDLDGAMSLSVGNVFGPHLEDFRPEKLRISATLGIETATNPGNAFQFLLGVGTDTFERGPTIDSVRFILGTNRGF